MEGKFCPGEGVEVTFTEPVPPPELCTDSDPNRLWIGNLDPVMSEFALLKLLQTFGKLSKYDYVYHKDGPEKGQPRGFCFATYETREDAVKAQRMLNGRKLKSKRMFVKWAHEQKQPVEKRTVQIVGTGTDLNMSSKNDVKDPQSAIREIEEKLRSMQENPDVKLPQPRISQRSRTKDSKSAQKPYDRTRKR